MNEKEALTSEEHSVVMTALEKAHDSLVATLSETQEEEKQILHQMAVLEDIMDKLQEA